MARDLAESTEEAAGLSGARLDAVHERLTRLVDAGELAGAAWLVARHGRIARRGVIGRKDLASGEPVALDTIFRIYSMTKPVTGVAMMTLWDQGLWSPDDPIEKHLPELSGLKVFAGLGGDGEILTEPAERPATMRELMTHTAGFSYGFSEEPYDKAAQEIGLWQAKGLDEFVGRLARLPLAYQPGTKWLYSLSMDVQGAIVERLTGQSLAEVYQERLFGPLGMVDTGFFVPEAKRARLATLYRSSESRGLVPLERPPFLGDNLSPPTLASGGGGLVSTLDDYARFAQMLLNRGELGGVRVVSEDAVRLMSANHLPDWMLTEGFGVGAQQIRPGFGHGFDCAVFVDPDAAGIPVGKGSFQWDGAAGTWFWVDPENDLIFVGMIQRMSALPDQANCQQLTQKLMAKAML
ncbi:MAG TPA: serine hydrolase domain-containing protein [Caulobacteraceae bacterium]|nr:serine hydrolase domain-containing protein [Caulobacteraceae bacterium]